MLRHSSRSRLPDRRLMAPLIEPQRSLTFQANGETPNSSPSSGIDLVPLETERWIYREGVHARRFNLWLNNISKDPADR